MDRPEFLRDMTLEAFADTIVPGNKRAPDDRAVAGASSEPGAVEAGALALFEMPATGITEALDFYAENLNLYAEEFISERELEPATTVPAFVSLTFDERTTLVRQLLDDTHEQRELWILLALFSSMAFDIAPHLHTAEALAAGHPGLTTLGFRPPDPDGLWRSPAFSYRRQLAQPHPNTTPSGSPA